jgi:hypothetical protein
MKLLPAFPGPVGLFVATGYLVVSLLGLKAGYDFGKEISGVLMGWVLALNSAAFFSLIFSAVVAWVTRWAERVRPAKEPG